MMISAFNGHYNGYYDFVKLSVKLGNAGVRS